MGRGPSATHEQNFERPEKTQRQFHVVVLRLLLLDLLLIQQQWLKCRGYSQRVSCENCKPIKKKGFVIKLNMNITNWLEQQGEKTMASQMPITTQELKPVTRKQT